MAEDGWKDCKSQGHRMFAVRLCLVERTEKTTPINCHHHGCLANKDNTKSHANMEGKMSGQGALNPRQRTTGNYGTLIAREIVFPAKRFPVGYPVHNGQF